MAGMGAVVMRDFGGPEVLEWAEVPRPVAEGDRVLVRVAACGLNHLDLWTRSGHRGRSIPLPHILGNEPVGFVEEVGPRAEGVAPGDFVVVAPGFLDRFRADRSGWDTRYPEYGVIGNRAPGGYGEYLAVRAEHVVRVSDRWSPEEWAATPLVFLTAWHMLVGRARLRPGETVLVVGAGSGVGSSAVQIARHFACRVIATAGTREKLSAAKELGAHAAVLHGQDAWSAEVREASGGRGVDVVV
ncbi:MAG: alcohol dehydrogenase catalytic domain-containing protein, partial [Gemmatimonadota bacterium]|nr:alcohol dehydrogenase catalytic domain-containing protein [Gemmatimonadota bacterium]